MTGTPSVCMFFMILRSSSDRPACWQSFTTFSSESPEFRSFSSFIILSNVSMPNVFFVFFCVLYNNVSNRLWQWVASIWWVYTLLATLLYYCFSLSPSSSEKHTRAPPLDITVSQGIWSWAAEFASFHGSLPNLLPDDDCIIFKVESKFATLSEKKTGNLLKSTNCFSNQQNYTTM